jgi:hypothetical protein
MHERQDSIRQGIGVPPESEVGRQAERRKQERDARAPCRETGGMGGTSDADSPADEAAVARVIREREQGLSGE